MAILRRGKRKGELVKIHQFANDWVYLDDGTIVNPTSLQYSLEEMDRIFKDENKGMWDQLWKWDFPYIKRRRTS